MDAVARGGDERMDKRVRTLVELGSALDAVNKYQLGTVHVAARSGHTDCVRALVALGATVDARTYYGETPLHLAAVGGYVDVVRELVSSGADLHICDKDGQKPEDKARGRNTRSPLISRRSRQEHERGRK